MNASQLATLKYEAARAAAGSTPDFSLMVIVELIEALEAERAE